VGIQAIDLVDIETSMGTIAAHAREGIARLILRPLAATDAELLDHSRRLIDAVLPRVGQIALCTD
jgi:hypothetical protein